MSVYLIATLDTKGPEASFVRDQLISYGVNVTVVDAGCLGEPTVAADVSRSQLFQAAGRSLDNLQAAEDRGAAVKAAADGAAAIVRTAFAEGKIDGVVGLGGSAGTTIATAGMRELPIGVPKVMISTLASGAVRPWVQDKDVLMLNSVVDIAGLNRISRAVLGQAARAVAGMVTLPLPEQVEGERPLIAATMFGVTTPCVETARGVLEAAGYEVLVFHATGNGGQAMESLIREGQIAGVLDVTTTELADELVGGILTAGPDRLTAAGQVGVPQVLSVGATDMVNFGPLDSVPKQFADRLLYEHNPTVTLMRTTPEECAAIGRVIGEKASHATGPVRILLPTRGVSAIDVEGQPFDNPDARRALFAAIHESAGDAEITERDEHINDAGFARAAAETLLSLIASCGAKP